MSQPDKLVLFDIDGTMLYCGSSARESLARALSDITGKEIALHLEDVAGNTDLGIIQHALKPAGMLNGSTEDIVRKVGERYLEILKVEYPKRNDQYLYPGIPELLERTSSHPELRIGLLTGNLIEGAKVKLAKFDIWHHFSIGAFGSDSIDRNELPEIAWDKALTSLGEQYSPEQTIIVGDTPRDALCAKVNGTKVLIFLRREEWRGDIMQQEPIAIMDSSENVDAIMDVLTGFNQ